MCDKNQQGSQTTGYMQEQEQGLKPQSSRDMAALPPPPEPRPEGIEEKLQRLQASVGQLRACIEHQAKLISKLCESLERHRHVTDGSIVIPISVGEKLYGQG